jgi:hypothetical protein
MEAEKRLKRVSGISPPPMMMSFPFGRKNSLSCAWTVSDKNTTNKTDNNFIKRFHLK